MNAVRLNRRRFLQLTGISAAGLLVGLRSGSAGADKDVAHVFSALLAITDEGHARIVFKKAELGQGALTLCALVAAEELDMPLDHVHVDVARPGPRYADMLTGGSFTARYIYTRLRPQFAAVREVLCQAAAGRWGIETANCETRDGAVIRKSDTARLTYGELAAAAARLPLPERPSLKPASRFRLLGRDHGQHHNPDIVTGRARFGLDQRIPGQVYACLVRAPVVGARLKSFDAAACRSIPGFIAAYPISGTSIDTFPEYIRDAVAVVAEHTYAAMSAARQVTVEWSRTTSHFDTARYMHELETMTRTGQRVFREEGDPATAGEDADTVLEAVYRGPFLAHAPLEPMNATAWVTTERCDVWAPCHAQSTLHDAVTALTGLPADAVAIHTTLMGGSFGRRLQVDYGIEAVMVAMAAGRPVQVVWTREDDMRFGCLRSPYVQRMRGAVKDGRITAFQQAIACSSVWQLREPEQLVDGIDYTVIMPARILPYAIDNLRLSAATTALPAPLAWWRASYPTIMHTVQECWMDELIHAAGGTDPFEARLELLADGRTMEFEWQPGWGSERIDRARLAAVLRHLRDRVTRSNGAGRGFGLACSIYAGTYIAQCVELTVDESDIMVERVICAVDCGRALNPDGVIAQIEGGIIFGLSAALRGAITFADGQIEQSNFPDYPILTMARTPRIDTHILPSERNPTGVGEPGCHPIMAATCNAIFDATGIRIRDLPIGAQLHGAPDGPAPV